MKKQAIFLGTFFIIISILTMIFSGCIDKKPTEQTALTSLEKKVQYLVENLSLENYAIVYDNFNEDMKSALPVIDIKNAWNSLISSYGNFEEIVHIQKTEEQGWDVVYASCSFSTLGLLDLRFVFDNQSKIAGFQFVPTKRTDEYTLPAYVNTSKFIEENITIGSTPWQLPATLTRPIGNGPFPAVVLVHGSGPNDRDETIGPNKPFKDIAQGLATNGIVVLRYDKRTFVYPKECAEALNFTPQEEVIDDALAAIISLQNNSYVNTSQIFLLGHSLGAMLAPEIVMQTTALKGVLMLAAPARPFEDLYLAQLTYLSELDGVIDENEQTQLESVSQLVQKIKTLNISVDEYVFNTPYSYWEYLSTYDAVETTQNLNIQVFILQGKRDYQVTYEDDFLKWQTILNNSASVTMQLYESLNHLFISGTGKPTNTEYNSPGNVDGAVITDVVSWIQCIT